MGCPSAPTRSCSLPVPTAPAALDGAQRSFPGLGQSHSSTPALSAPFAQEVAQTDRTLCHPAKHVTLNGVGAGTHPAATAPWSHATSRHLGGLQGPGCHLCMAVIVLCQHPGVMACSEDENPCGRAGAGGKGRDRQGGKGGQEQAGREGRNRQQNQAGACAFKHYSSAAGSQGCLRQTPIYLPSCPRSCQQGSAGGTRSTLPRSALAQACACPTPCCRHWHAPVRRPCHPPCPLPAIRKPLWVSGQHQNLWPWGQQAGEAVVSAPNSHASARHPVPTGSGCLGRW